MARKWFQLVCADGSPATSAASVYLEIEDVDSFRHAVKQKLPNLLAGIAAPELIVLANGVELEADDSLADIDETVTLLVRVAPRVRVIEPYRITREREWFSSSSWQSRTRVKKLESEAMGGPHTCAIPVSNRFDVHAEIRYFEMARLPRLVHPMAGFPTILERDSYVVIFDEFMKHVRACLGRKVEGHVVVTGNPGVGKSRFLLYCVFRLINGLLSDALDLTKIKLVLQVNKHFYLYVKAQRMFVLQEKEAIRQLSDDHGVLRLIDVGQRHLSTWRGVSVAFSTADATSLVRNFLKDNCWEFIMPVWTLDELTQCNGLVRPALQLPDAMLEERYNRYGGNPRSVFHASQGQWTQALNAAIYRFSGPKLLKYMQDSMAVRDYRYEVVQMVPSAPDYRAVFQQAFLSEEIGERIISSRAMDMDCQRKLSEFAIANDLSYASAMLRGQIYRLQAHRWFTSEASLSLVLTGLNPTATAASIVTNEAMQRVDFRSLEEIRLVENQVIYYRPWSSTFRAADAVIVDGINRECYGLLMTVDGEHGVECASLLKLMSQLKSEGLPQARFRCCFVMPSRVREDFWAQAIPHEREMTNVAQYMVGVDLYANWTAQRDE